MMGDMADSLFCPLRKKWVSALPEEKIRQALVHDMTQRLGFPLGSIVLEKSLSQLPHLQTSTSLPKRRADLIVLAKNLHPQYPFYPLLLVECKAVPLTQKVLRQIVGYNQFVKACFIAAVNQTTAYTGWYDPEQQDYCFQEGLVSYERLILNPFCGNASLEANFFIQSQ